jgi:hypothetical protein
MGIEVVPPFQVGFVVFANVMPEKCQRNDERDQRPVVAVDELQEFLR